MRSGSWSPPRLVRILTRARRRIAPFSVICRRQTNSAHPFSGGDHLAAALPATPPAPGSSPRTGRLRRPCAPGGGGTARAAPLRLERQLDRVLVRRVAPPDERVVLLGRVHRVVHQHARAAHELHELLAPVRRGRRTGPAGSARCPRHRRAPAPRRFRAREAVPQRAAGVPDGDGRDLVPVPVRRSSASSWKSIRACELLERDREHHGRHLVADDPVDARLERLRAPDREAVPLLEQRREERNALDVVPVGVRQEDVAGDRRPVRARRSASGPARGCRCRRRG